MGMLFPPLCISKISVSWRTAWKTELVGRPHKNIWQKEDIFPLFNWQLVISLRTRFNANLLLIEETVEFLDALKIVRSQYKITSLWSQTKKQDRSWVLSYWKSLCSSDNMFTVEQCWKISKGSFKKPSTIFFTCYFLKLSIES